ncbi:Bgt-5238 [Blumeria graminis f. sp. tritici]|uniref:Bgt-5238 n=2 Tax=Blumeria graminis f. sp. tritici TaxID=62690 RepID=A0A9X9QE72_BLUGR|nr:Epsin-like protein [Blumeria graminis f. sp. tritici 96224]VDB90438.1 Bgt-5238 [Blumeria graminis f. sp. tritici]
MSKVMRSVKNVTKGYSSVQVKVRNATSNDPWGPTGSEMSQIAQMTFNSPNEFYEIMDMIDKRLNDKGKNWRHVLKALKVLDYCLHEGSELVVTWAHKNIYIIKTLREFQYVDEDGRDVGQNVRVSAKELTSLILDEDRLRGERSDRRNWKSRVTGIEEFGPSHDDSMRRSRNYRAQRADEEDAEYKLAIEASKYQEEEDRKRRQSQREEPEDEDLAKAIKLSKEEEEQRRRELEEQNAASLFDDDPIQTSQPTGFNQGYQQQTQVDWAGNPIDPNMQQHTGYISNMYTGFHSQPTGFQPEPSLYPNGYPNGFAPQAIGLDPFGQQQLQPQPTTFNPYIQQSPINFQQQPEVTVPTGTNNPWATSNQTATQASLKPMPTGSNNPFASSFIRPQSTTNTPRPILSTLQEKYTSNFNSNTTSLNIPKTYTPPPIPTHTQNNFDSHHSKLNSLLASGDGMDTFGNTGEMRIPSQHTAPGTFVNSSGAGLNRLTSSKTGTNPFLQTQFTAMPQVHYEDNITSGIGRGQSQTSALPGISDVSNSYGQQPSNPFGPKSQEKGGHGDLIQF